MEIEPEYTNRPPRKVSYAELEMITSGFAKERQLGHGKFGVVYKGVHENGQNIAVKVLRITCELLPDDKQFKNEWNNLARLKHPNIVELLGYCDETEEELVDYNGEKVIACKIHQALCLEYVHKGSLQNYISDKYAGHNWHATYKIIKGICEGLRYLHGTSKYPLVHLDLKPDNILLDDNMVPKIADFGLSKLFCEQTTRVTSSPLGTLGYLPPEYIDNRLISREFDIFSLGVIIIKTMIGPSRYFKNIGMESHKFIKLVRDIWCRNLQGIISPSSLQVRCLQVTTCIEIALKCLQVDRQKRPSAFEIVSMLNETEKLVTEQASGLPQFHCGECLFPIKSTVASLPSSDNANESSAVQEVKDAVQPTGEKENNNESAEIKELEKEENINAQKNNINLNNVFFESGSHSTVSIMNSTQVHEIEVEKDENSTNGKVNIEKYDLEKILDEQNTLDLYCANCKSCITRRMIVRKRKRTVRQILRAERPEKPQVVEPSADAPNQTCADIYDQDAPIVFSLLSCCNFFIPTGCGFNIFRMFAKRVAEPQIQVVDIPSENFGSWFLSCFQTIDSPQMSADAGPVKEPLLSGSQSTKALPTQISLFEDTKSSAHNHATHGKTEELKNPLPTGSSSMDHPEVIVHTSSPITSTRVSLQRITESGIEQYLSDSKEYEAFGQRPTEQWEGWCNIRNSVFHTSDIKNISLKTLQDITGGFSEERVLGCGGFGKVFKGIYEDGKVIAVKMLLDIPELCDDELFQSKVDFLLSVEHQNTMQLVGYCNEWGRELIEHKGRLILAENKKKDALLQIYAKWKP